MIVAIDYDGTIADTNMEKVRWIKSNLGIDIQSWQCDRTNCVPLIGKENYKNLGNYVYERESTLEAVEVPGALEAIRSMAGTASTVGIAELHLVTARPPRRVEFAREWLKMHEVLDCFTSVTSSADTTKADVCRTLGAGVLIDDDARHVHATDGVPLVRVLLQHGREDRPECAPGVVLARSWPDVVGIVRGQHA
jgi:hypothetical protein